MLSRGLNSCCQEDSTVAVKTQDESITDVNRDRQQMSGRSRVTVKKAQQQLLRGINNYCQEGSTTAVKRYQQRLSRGINSSVAVKGINSCCQDGLTTAVNRDQQML